MNAYVNIKHTPTSTRISSPLSRLFWLSCKHNEVISPLLGKPYKLLSIFEQWASDEGITDRLSGDTLKTALVRGSPTSMSDWRKWILPNPNVRIKDSKISNTDIISFFGSFFLVTSRDIIFLHYGYKYISSITKH